MPPQRTFSDVNRELRSVKATADRLHWERNETKENLDTLGRKYKKVKQALKAKTKPVPKEKIPKPPGQAGRKPTIDKNGRKRNGYSLQDAMNLSDQKAIYLDFRSLVVGYLPKDRYDTFNAIPTLVRGSICAKVLKKYPWLDDFEAHWPVDDVLRGNFNNRTSYRKDRDNGALARRQGARKAGQGGAGEVADEEDEVGDEDETAWGGNGYDSDRDVEVRDKTRDEEEEDVTQRQVYGRKRAKIIESEDDEDDQNNDDDDQNDDDDEQDETEVVQDDDQVAEETERYTHISKKRKRDEDPEQDTCHATRGKRHPAPNRTASPTLSCNLRTTPFQSPSLSPLPSRGFSVSLSPAPSSSLTPAAPIAKTAKKPAKKGRAPTAAKAGIRRSERKK